MSFGIKLAITIAALAVLAWGFVNYSQRQPMPTDDQAAGTMQPSPTSVQPTTPAQGVSARGTSDTELDADLKDIDTQTQAASQSSAAIDSGINDKSGDVTY